MHLKAENMVNATVALVRSEKTTAEAIGDAEVRDMVREAVKLAGGLDFIEDGQFVVIKPNLVTTRSTPGLGAFMLPFTDPFKEKSQVPELVNGITTDRRVTKAMVELVRERNPSGKVYIMECAGDGATSENFRRMGYTHENIPGVDAFVPIGEDGAYHDVASPDLVAVEVKNRQYQKLPKFLREKYYFDKTYYSADVIISLACVKNHMNAAVTGGIKNIGLGACPANIYSPKGKTVSAFVIGHFWEPINQWIHDYYSARPVDFVLSDGLQGLAYGPSAQGAPSYDAAKMNMRILLASKDPVACDTIQSCIVGVDPEKIDYLKDLADEGFGVIDTAKIDVVGNARVDEVKKRFPFAGGVVGAVMSSGPKKHAICEDFDPPQIAIDSLTADEKQLSANLMIDEKVNRIELFVDDQLVGSFRQNLDTVKQLLNGAGTKGSHEATFLAYDRFFNRAAVSRTFEIS